jgi:glycosyltransferase involved in cell wall biosynthesis
VPFVLSWSMMNALACGAVVVGSDTAPVQEMITDGENGLLVDFFDPKAVAQRALEVLQDPPAYDPMRQSATQIIQDQYSLDSVLPQMLALYQQTAKRGRHQEGGPRSNRESLARIAHQNS